MHCFVYASARKPETYVWLDAPERATALPEQLTELLGTLRLVLEVDLDSGRKLPREDAATVLQNLQQQGWHLQMPPPQVSPAISAQR
ncbi:YcgL domain-containing protein [Frateuria aurantia]